MMQKKTSTKKVLFVATVVKTHIMEFHLPYLEMFKQAGWETAVAARNDYDSPEECDIPFCDHYYDVPFSRSPLKPQNLKAYKQLKKIIDSGEYDIIHCHTPVGAMLARMAARKARKKGTRVIYTAHGFHFFKGAPLKNWLLYYPVEKLLACKTDVLITINSEDCSRAKKLRVGKVCYIPGVGIDISRFTPDIALRTEKRKELGISEDAFVLLSVGELTVRKNHELALRALSLLKNENFFERVQYLICGSGVLEKYLKQLAEELGISEHIRFLGYRSDVYEIAHVSDLFVFMSLQEGLPVALMEAMASGLPAVCSRIRGNVDLIEDGVNGQVADMTPESVAGAIAELQGDPDLRARYATAARETVLRFSLDQVKEQYRSVYFEDAEQPV